MAGLTLGIGLLDCDREAAISMYVCAVLVIGVQAGGVDPNALDITPAYAGTSCVSLTIWVFVHRELLHNCMHLTVFEYGTCVFIHISFCTGTVHGIINLFSNVGGFVSPMLIEHVTGNSVSILVFNLSTTETTDFVLHHLAMLTFRYVHESECVLCFRRTAPSGV